MSEYIVSKMQNGNDTYKFKSAFQKEIAIASSSSTSTYPNRYIKISGIPTNTIVNANYITLLIGVKFNRYLVNIHPIYGLSSSYKLVDVFAISDIDVTASRLTDIAYELSSSSSAGTMDIYLKINAKGSNTRVTITNISEDLTIPFEVTDIGKDNTSYSGTTISAYFDALTKCSFKNLQTKELSSPISIGGVSKSTVEDAISGLNVAIPVAKEFSIPANSTTYIYQNYYFKITDIPTKNTKADAQVMTFLIGMYGNVYLVYVNPRYSENVGGRLVQCIDVTNYTIVSPNIIECAYNLSSTSEDGSLSIWFKIKLYSSNQTKLTITNISANATVDWDVVLIGNDGTTYSGTSASAYFNNLTKGSLSHLQKIINLSNPNNAYEIGTIDNMFEDSPNYNNVFNIPVFISVEKTVTSDFTLEFTAYGMHFNPTTVLTIMDCSIYAKPAYDHYINIPMKIKTVKGICNSNGSYTITIECKANSDAASYNSGKCTRFYGMILAGCTTD